ncbi:MAG TPA: ATP-dependent Clp protease ATP-binding subunit [Candidatus Sumerlaeota bacterium]|mgnify:CR=1 FL=1|nr:ATP-dependent Clp protease ATP-binding subunit [Candidatus Sumerlaeota bacterium]HOR28409.1 ATP-dependent Clp protease ATP-binding subunit [Candidatus Sumerlaeota bacterium]HPK03278.1 ATP-dependent Clp protease ATP-binding subunit [Candidatus Sumerlaeota bacterium]
MIDKTPYTPGMREVLKLSKAEAGRLGHDYIGPEHYLLGVIRKGDGLAIQTLMNLDVDLEDVKMELERMVEVGKGPTVGLFSPNADAKRVLETSKQIANEMKHGWVGTEHLLLALIKEEHTLASKCLRQFGVDYEKAKKEVITVIEGSSTASTKSKESFEKSKTPALDMFGRDLTQLAKEAKLDPVIGREEEIERILQILCRRTKNNPILLGEPGVGKTAIVEGLAQKIVSGDIPELLRDKRLLSLDLAAIVAGTKYRGQFEERLKAIMQEIRRNPDVLIFIDELHTLIGAGAAEGAIDASNMLKPALSRGEIQCIGATTLEEYRKYIEKDGALERRFQSITIDPPTIDQTVQILKGLRSRYEQHHNVIISDEAIEQAAVLSDRYVTDRFLPDKAIDVIDEAGARARLQATSKPQEIKDLEQEVAELDEQLRVLAHKQEFEKCAELKEKKEQIRQRIDGLMREWGKAKESKENVQVIGEKNVAYIVSKWTGIPVMRLEEEETQKLLRMEEELTKRVVSQSDAISAIAKAVRRARSGLKDPKRPTGSFIFLGPTGVGKTELAKALAEFLFGDEDALIRIDMSEYMEKYSVSRLLGAPPGYVGYEEGGQLTEKVRQKPYSVVLLDEIEKAHPDVYSLLLQVFDDGRLTDSWGHIVDFRNTVIILTSNIGTRRLKKSGTLGFNAGDEMLDYEGLKGKVLGELKKAFNPEFLNRLDEAIVFKSLEKGDIEKIVDIMMDRLNDRLVDRGIVIHLDQEAKDFLVEQGYDSEYGARPMRRAIQKYIEDPLSSLMITGEVPDGADVNATRKKDADELEFTVKVNSGQREKVGAKSAGGD